MTSKQSDYAQVYPHGHLDPCDFEVVDVVGNVYNRLVLFNSQMIHAASCYFGNSLETGRLFQLFFFDLELQPTSAKAKSKSLINLAFYTCFYGAKNNPAYKIPELPSTKYDCYYYTNNLELLESLKSTGWIGIYDDKPVTENINESSMYSKYVKVLPDQVEPIKNYDYTCYLDSKLGLVFEEFVEQYIEKHFNSFEDFRDQFNETANAIQGSGWCYLSKNGEIKMIQNHKWKNDIILLIDLWEHAFNAYETRKDYLKKPRILILK